MGSLLLALTIVVAVASATTTTTTTPSVPLNESTSSIPKPDRSLLVDLLRGLGISDICLSNALDYCTSVPQERQVATLLKESQDLLQETRALLHEERVLQQETREMLQDATHTVNKTRILPRHCKDLLDAGEAHSGVYVIHPYPGEPERRLNVYCDQRTDGGGWTMFQRRKNSSIRENFFRTFQEYTEGFGNLEEEFWLGLDALHLLTATEPQELRIDLADWERGYAYAKYAVFRVEDPTAKYRLTVEGYSGTANDSFTYHSGQKFSTHDSDNDSSSGNCAELRGAWWYKSCHHSNLNGYQYEDNPSPVVKGIIWYHWRGHTYSLRRTTMMLRPTPRIVG